MPDLLYLGNKLSKHGLNPTSVETLGERLTEDFVCVRGSNKKNTFLRLLHMWWLVLRNRNARYLLIDTYSSKAFWYAITSARLARSLNLGYIPILRGGNLPKRKRKSPKILYNYLQNAAHVVSPSEFLRVEMAAFCPRKYEVIPNFIDLINYPFHDKCAISGVRLLWVRSFDRTYNPFLAIDVLDLLLRKGLDAQLAMVGPDKDGSLEKTKGYAKDKGVFDKVVFTGGLTKPEWIEFSKDYNIFINTTNVDNTPVSLMEAMALGFPVISTNVGGVPYLINSGINGLLVPPNNDSLFATQIINLINNPSQAMRIGVNARKTAERLDWTNIRKNWSALLNTSSR